MDASERLLGLVRQALSRGSSLHHRRLLLAESSLDLGLLRDLKCVVDLDPEIPDGALQLRVTKQQLDGPDVLDPLVDQRRLRSAQRVCAVPGLVQTNTAGPALHNSAVLAYGQVAFLPSPREEVAVERRSDPATQAVIDSRVASVISNCTGR